MKETYKSDPILIEASKEPYLINGDPNAIVSYMNYINILLLGLNLKYDINVIINLAITFKDGTIIDTDTSYLEMGVTSDLLNVMFEDLSFGNTWYSTLTIDTIQITL